MWYDDAVVENVTCPEYQVCYKRVLFSVCDGKLVVINVGEMWLSKRTRCQEEIVYT